MYLAIDIGATKTLLAVFSHNGRLLRRTKFPTSHNEATFLSDLAENLKDFRSTSVHAVTVAIPGIVQKNCSFIFGNLPWKNPDLTSLIKASFSCPIYFVNDADLATVYESYFCAGKTIYLTFSTGIGGGIAKDGHLLPESATFEPGHRSYLWENRNTEWEDFAAASAIRHAKGDRDVTTLKKASDLADIAARLTPGLTSIITEEHPTTIVIGGPLGLIYKRFRRHLKAALLEHLDKRSLPKIIAARRPTESVVYGAYLYARYQK